MKDMKQEKEIKEKYVYIGVCPYCKRKNEVEVLNKEAHPKYCTKCGKRIEYK